MKRCARCGTEKSSESFGRNACRADGLNVYCRLCTRADSKRREQGYRLRAIESLGGECAHCGISDPRVLCIDHIEGGGTQERNADIKKRQIVFYRAVIEDGSRFQVLCWNCNWIKRLEHDTPTYVNGAMTFTLTPS